MKKFLKFFGGVVILLIVALLGFLIYFNSAYPDVDPPATVKVQITPERIARGEYLANHVTVCMDCHSSRDWSKFSGPITPGTLGKGGDRFDENMGFPGVVYAKNITPAALNTWTDGELMRAITNGVNKDDQAFFPLMPYLSYNHLTQEDLYSIVAYIRSLPPIEGSTPETELNFPLNFIVKTIPPKEYHPTPEINKNNPSEYGGYLVKIGGCFDCHTPSVKGEFIEGKEFAGGGEFNLPGGLLKSANITPDPATGIGSWTKEQFVKRFKAYDPDSNQVPSVAMTDYNTIMPWTMYSGMTEEDLGAIYEYLLTLKPIANNVARWTPNK